MTQVNPTNPETVRLILLKSADAPKLSKRSAGQSIRYCLWTNDQRSDVWWQIAGNIGGQHSMELVATDKIQATLDTQAGSEPFRTKRRGRVNTLPLSETNPRHKPLALIVDRRKPLDFRRRPYVGGYRLTPSINIRRVGAAAQPLARRGGWSNPHVVFPSPDREIVTARKAR